MALDRQRIEKKDFPTAGRGYDPEAVDAHLSAVADQVEEFKHSTRRRSETLASASSEHVRAIVQAAEASAAEIVRQAEEEADEIRAEAGREAGASREQATERLRDRLGDVSDSTRVMLERLEAMGSGLQTLIESLREGANRLNDDLRQLERELGEMRGAVTRRSEPESARATRGQATRSPSLQPEVGSAKLQGDALGEAQEPPETRPGRGGRPRRGARQSPRSQQRRPAPPPPETRAEPGAPAPAGAPSTPGNGSDDDEAARLVALNMALDGSPRGETERYLAEHFRVSDRARLLDEVYASVGE